MKSNTYKEYIAPIVVLVCICLVASALLGVVYGISKPIIDVNSQKAADEARATVLADADAFTPYEGELVESAPGSVYATEAYIANNKAGVVVTVQSKSFGGALTEMVGINANGEITGVVVTDHADTPGLGTKDFEPKYLDQYKGLTEMKSTSVKEDGQINFISGASVSGSAVHYGVYCALDQFAKMGGVQ